MRIGGWTAVVLCVAITACGSKGASTPTVPTTTTPAAPTLTSITINGPDALLTTTAADYTATASFSNQITETASATWTVNSTSIAAVSSTGRVTAQTHGSVTLTASYQGQTATKTVNVVNNYEGNWSGVVVRLRCQLNGALGRRITRRLCPEGPNIRNPWSLVVSQPSPFTEVTGQVNLNTGFILNARGTVSSDGRLILTGDTEFQIPDPVSRRPEIIRFSLLKWDTRLAGFTLSLLAGRFDVNRTESLWEGNVYEEYEIEQMRRSTGLDAN